MVLFQLRLKTSFPAKIFAAFILAVAALAWSLRCDPFVRAATPQRSLHDLHVKGQGMGCKDCHVQGQLPKQEVCQNCHEASEVEKLFSTYVINVSQFGAPKPEDHTQDYRRVHGAISATDPANCSVCHEQRFCQDCHEGENIQGAIHPLNFRRTHAFEAAGHEQDCLVCHETREFCVDCHRQNLVLFHPLGPSWAKPEEGGAHKEEAEADLESCLDCHDLGNADPVCTRPGCHGSGGDEE